MHPMHPPFSTAQNPGQLTTACTPFSGVLVRGVALNVRSLSGVAGTGRLLVAVVWYSISATLAHIAAVWSGL
jgi:hypothetical protein